MKIIRFPRAACIAIVVLSIVGMAPSTASATPTSQVVMPTTDTVPFKTLGFNFGTYLRTGAEGADPNRQTGGSNNLNLPAAYDVGLKVGVLPFGKLQAEVGFDLFYGSANTAFGLDKYPFYGHFKIATPEDNTWIPAVAVGMFNIGTKSGDARKGELATNQDMAYGVVAKTLPVVGRLTAGYYIGNKKALVTDERDAGGNFKSDEKGVMLSWDRTMSEISDKLWLVVEHMGGKNPNGQTSFGGSWAFAKNVVVLVAYDVWNNRKVAGQDTVTIQVGINYP